MGPIRDELTYGASPSPYVFPKLPPRFRRWCRFAQGLYLLRQASAALCLAGGLALVLLDLDGSPPPSMLVGVVLCTLLLPVLCKLLETIPGRFWRCPCCALPFPHCAPALRGWILREEHWIAELKRLHIPYQKPRFCPLMIPARCPACKTEFFRLPDHTGTT